MSGTRRLPLGLPTRIRAIEIIGRGSSATVWRARDTMAGRDVAVKVLDAPKSADVAAMLGQRLELEARALSRLAGVDGVLEVYDVGRTDAGVGWIVSAYAPGGSMLVRGPAGSSSLDLVEHAVRLSSALAAAHRLEVVHGDITPGNVLFDAVDRAALADFGLATLGTESATSAGLTPRFAAPECVRGAAPSPASDLYALASSLSWSWTGDGAEPIVGLLAAAMTESPIRRPSIFAWHEAWLELRPRSRR